MSESPSWYKSLTNPTIKYLNINQVTPPPGFDSSSSTGSSTKKVIRNADQDNLKVKKAWELATSPAKSIPVNAFMAYMTGNSLQIIPITMTLMLFTNPLKQIAQIPTLFKKFETPQNSSEIFSAKLIFLLCQIGSMLVGVWRLQNMGLLPTTRSDWVAWENPVEVLEHASGI